METRFLIFAILAIFLLGGCYESISVNIDDSGTDTETHLDTDSETLSDPDTESHVDWLFFEDFDDYNVGDLISEVGTSDWEVWPGGEDAPISDINSESAPNSMFVDNKTDVFINVEYITGSYDIKFDIFVDEGMMAYYNFQAVAGQESRLFQMFFYAGGVGNILVDEEFFSFEYTQSQWLVCSNLIDLDQDVAIVLIDDQPILEWQYSLAQGGNGSYIELIDFYDQQDPPGGRFWVDNVRIRYADEE